MSGHAAHTPDKPALVLGGRTVGYGELDARGRRLAQALGARGAGPNRPVATFLPNGIEYFEVATAATMLDAPFLPINWHLKADELGFILSDSGARVVVVDASLSDQARPALDAASGCEVLTVGDDYDKAIAEAEPGSVEELAARTGPSFMFYTSGTTARPKGVVHGRPDPARAALVQNAQVELWWWGPDDVFVMTGPAYHAAHGGWASTALYVGATTVIMQSWDAREWMELVERHGGTRSFMVPAHFIRLLEVPEEERRKRDLSSLRLIVHAAAPCPVTVKRRVIEALRPCEIHELYGASEGGATRISPSEWLEHPGSVGKAWPGVRIRVLDDSGNELPAGEHGLIFVSPAGGSRFHYHNDPDKTTEAWLDDSFTVGDIGYLDEGGYLYITDRKSDMVLWGGVNIAPREIEEVLYSHPGVVDCAVFGIPDERDGEHVKAMVEARPGVGVEELAAHVRGSLADYKVPHVWQLVDSLPRDPNGKVLKRLLRAAHWEERG